MDLKRRVERLEERMSRCARPAGVRFVNEVRPGVWCVYGEKEQYQGTEEEVRAWLAEHAPNALLVWLSRPSDPACGAE